MTLFIVFMYALYIVKSPDFVVAKLYLNVYKVKKYVLLLLKYLSIL